jgi:hypothetical protein
VDSDFCDLVIEDSWEWMNPHVKNFEKTLLSKKKKIRYRDGIRIAIMQIYDQENGGNSGLRERLKGQK